MSKSIVRMSIDDAHHFSEAQRATIIASYPAHELQARVSGMPALGSGRVFPIVEADIVCEPVSPLPPTWRRIVGIDFGWDHPFAAVELAHDTEADIVYVTKTYKQREATPILHAAAIKPWGADLNGKQWIPVAWPHDGLAVKVSDSQSAPQLRHLYEKQGLNMLSEHATHEEGGYGLEAGIMEMLDRMKTGRWKVFRQCEDWLAEFRYYHRKEGVIVKERDDVLSASRVGLMMIRYAEAPPRPRSRYDFGSNGVRRTGWAA